MNPRIKKFLRLKAKAEKAAAENRPPVPIVEAAPPVAEAPPTPAKAKVFPPATKKAVKKTKRS